MGPKSIMSFQDIQNIKGFKTIRDNNALNRFHIAAKLVKEEIIYSSWLTSTLSKTREIEENINKNKKR